MKNSEIAVLSYHYSLSDGYLAFKTTINGSMSHDNRESVLFRLTE
ncbi:hypothetical protein MHI37_27500 [Paenibacillus sp. FSL H8-0548]|nr:hypothetical protein [Paenibacillus sp. FSL H8-0548]